MKFLLFVLVIRYLFVLLDRAAIQGDEDQTDEKENSIHPSEYQMR